MAAFSLKQEIYLLISISGGMLAIFFLFKSLLKAVQKHLGPVVGSHILFPRSKRYLSFAFVIILVVSFWVRVTRDLSSGVLLRTYHFLKTRLRFVRNGGIHCCKKIVLENVNHFIWVFTEEKGWPVDG